MYSKKINIINNNLRLFVNKSLICFTFFILSILSTFSQELRTYEIIDSNFKFVYSCIQNPENPEDLVNLNDLTVFDNKGNELLFQKKFEYNDERPAYPADSFLVKFIDMNFDGYTDILFLEPMWTGWGWASMPIEGYHLYNPDLKKFNKVFILVDSNGFHTDFNEEFPFSQLSFNNSDSTVYSSYTIRDGANQDSSCDYEFKVIKNNVLVNIKKICNNRWISLDTNEIIFDQESNIHEYDFSIYPPKFERTLTNYEVVGKEKLE